MTGEIPGDDAPDIEKSEWLSCPNCGSSVVTIGVSYDGEVGFNCQDCDAQTDRDFELQWSEFEADQYQETGEFPERER